MTLTRNIVLVGSEDETTNSKFVTRLEPIRIHENEALAIKSIFHGPIFNISNKNNIIYFRMPLPLGYKDNDQNSLSIKRMLNIPQHQFEIAPQFEIENRYDSFTIDEGFCKSAHDILKVIAKNFVLKFPSNRNYKQIIAPRLQIDSTRGENELKLIAKSMDILLHNNTPWNILGVDEMINDGKMEKNKMKHYQNSSVPAFVYVNIVENSYLNGKLSRNLTVVPLTMSDCWSYNEFKHPTYVPIEVKEFSNILVELRDLNGNYISFDPDYKTVITLHIKPIKGFHNC